MKRGNRGRKSSPKQSLNRPDLDNRKIGSPEELTLQRVQLAGTINGRLAAVRRLAYEAADSGESKGRRTSAFTLVTGSPLNRPKRSGRCLTRIRSRARDRALLGVLLGCGLRRREAAELEIAHLQRREDHWAIVDLVGKGRHIRTVPVPDWVKSSIDSWLVSAGLSEGRVFRCV